MDTFRDWYSSIKAHLYSAAYILYSIKNPPVAEDNIDYLSAGEWISFRDTNLQERLLFGLNNEFEFEFCDKPDFLFVSDQNNNLDYLKSEAVLIFYTFENIHPNFELFDYCIGYNSELSYGDRYCFCLPFVWDIKRFLKSDLRFKKTTRSEAKKLLNSKIFFCDFTYNHDNSTFRRKHYLDLLNSYKEVSNGGILYSPNSSKFVKSYDYSKKIEHQRLCKFSLIVESCEFSGGLVTEKIFHAIIADTIPIYYGEKDVSKYVNSKRFIDAKQYNDNELIDLISKIDNDDSLFIDYICQPALVDEDFFAKQQIQLTNFLRNIFNQNPKEALRKPANEYSTLWLKEKLFESDKLYNAGIFKTLRRLLSLFVKKITHKK